ncbi:HdeD family acid-resistance protein [Aerococcus urinae]|uniref:DUF308 domain-containing protein n=1 Tax=Aerococcus urinae TaxID=1376 RepID=A0A0X8FEV6_9LACT|nr:DUF308 domain-containing protein [Aerococcus urinae]AMB95925.1 hypothetical protein AWM73_05125 [Aerococcus urinae]MCY3032513.1 DUF308 domain-containing protein [Aerococcus urinae]MCY3038471.1 DUF308 domain-containing protein [Aerococcus urinae]MCY3044559.1 DUF308 domain-containing protein [Aerococcus urinae]MCY3046974.1 DUF308 domain-containing protein [Aerococcus urinae]
MTENQQGVKWGDLIVGIIFIILAIISFRNPGVSLVSLIYFYAAGAIVSGIMNLYTRHQLRQVSDQNYTVMLIVGILNLIIGVILFFNVEIGFLTIPFLVAIWFISEGIGLLTSSSLVGFVSPVGKGLSIFLGIVGIIVAISIFFNPLSAYFTVVFLIGAYFLFAGIAHIIRAL